MSVVDQYFAETGKDPPTEAFSTAGRIFTGLLLASKNVSLYPQGHSIAIKSIMQFHDKLDAYLQHHGFLKFEIEKDRIAFRGEEIFAGPFEEGTLPFTLFRDGMRWLEFIEGIEPDEIINFLAIVNQYSTLTAEPEGDIVTALWASQFPHIQYDVADFFIGSDGEKKESISAFKARSGSEETRPREMNPEEQEYPSEPRIDPALLILSAQEQAQLQTMIRLEEEADFSSYVNALLDSLFLNQDQDSFRTILDVLSEEFTDCLTRGEFEAPLKIVWGLRKFLEKYEKKISWAVPASEKFFIKTSGLESLSPIVRAWGNFSEEQMDILEQVFRYLDPQVIHTLVILLQAEPSKKRQQSLTDALINQASKDMRPLESLLNHSDEKLLLNLIPVIIRLNEKQALRCLTKLSRHSSALIHQNAIRAILQHHLVPVKDVFHFIKDSDETIQYLALKQLGQFRDPAIEELFLAYLKKTKFGKKQDGHVMECFRTLGKCGSSASIPFLRKTLFYRKWLPGKWKSAYRKGAAAALYALNRPEAQQVLEEARKSFFPSLRSLLDEAGQEFQKTKETGKHV